MHWQYSEQEVLVFRVIHRLLYGLGQALSEWFVNIYVISNRTSIKQDCETHFVRSEITKDVHVYADGNAKPKSCPQ